MTAFTQLQTRLQSEPHTWLVTGVAGFIGSKAATRLGYAPTQRIAQGLALAMPWYIAQKNT